MHWKIAQLAGSPPAAQRASFRCCSLCGCTRRWQSVWFERLDHSHTAVPKLSPNTESWRT